MDHSLIKLHGQTCETYVYNHTDKVITLPQGEIFCQGIVLECPTVEITERVFAISKEPDIDELEKEVGSVDYQYHKGELLRLLRNHRGVLATGVDKLGRIEIGKHHITLQGDEKQFFIPNYRLPISRREVIEKMVEEMKEDNIVRPSSSPYNSPLLLVPKKDGTWRLVIDYRKLNSQTVPDRFPMPVINDVLSQLGGASVFTSLDLMSGYWQVPLDEESKPLTAFSTHKEHLEFEVMPFGLTNAPLTFSRIMMQVLGDVPGCYVYLDDIIIFSTTMLEHFETLKVVLRRFEEAGLKIKVKKCQFLKRELEYLGHMINEDGIKMQEGKIKAIREYSPPENVKSLRRFIGMCSYYRPFVQNFATVAQPLTELLKQGNEYRWEKGQQEAFETLKQCLMKDPILVYPDFTKEFYLATDASSTGLGAVLLQKRKCRMRVISYASRVMTSAEKNYSTTERECLALFWGLKKFKHLILGYKVNLLTDHKPLLDLYKKREFINNSKFNRWFLAILKFNPEIKYIPGSSNHLADGLSRAYDDTESKAVNKKFCFTCQIIELDLDTVKEQQYKDEKISNIRREIIRDAKLWPDFELINGVLYKKSTVEQGYPRLCIPKCLVPEVLRLTHSSKLAGHPGILKTKEIVRKNYFWENYTVDVENFIHNCVICNQHKGTPNPPAPLERYPTELIPFQVVSMDFVGPFTRTAKGNVYILTLIDYLTRWVELVPCPDRLTSTVAEALKSRIIVQHSTPDVLLSDNAPEFTSEVMNKLCQYYEINKCEITAYKPSSNGAVERANQKIKNILRTLVTPDDTNWDIALGDVQLVINNSVNSSTGETPHFLLYGYNKRLPKSLCDDARPPRKIYNYDDYMSHRLLLYFETVRKTRLALQHSQRDWERYAKTKEKGTIKVGSQIYVKRNVPEGPNVKLSSKFIGPFRVLEILKGNKYKVVDEKTLSERIVHFNHIKLVKGASAWLQNDGHEIPTAAGDSAVGDDSQREEGGRYNLRRR